jgi:hypothetical protein
MKIIPILSGMVVGSLLTITATVAGAAEARGAGVEVILSNHRVVLGTNLPSCVNEDSTDGPCSWNVNHHDGNGVGLSFIVKADGQRVYVWPEDPRYGDETHWVNARMRHFIEVNYDWTPSMSCTYWSPGDDWSEVVCANGRKVTVNW